MYDILIKNAQLRRKAGLWNIAIEKGIVQKITKQPVRARAGKVIDAALNNGANEINSLDFSTSDTKAVRKVALLNAVQDARDKADIIAKGLGKRIVGIQSVSESTGYIETRRFGGNMLIAAAKDAATPIAPGSLSLTANVHVDFILSD